MNNLSLKQRNILVVEDDPLVAEVVADTIALAGAAVVGPALSLRQGLQQASQASLCGAILDIDLHGHAVWPIAEVLDGRRIPFLLYSGGDFMRALPDRWAGRPALTKPARAPELVAATARLQDCCPGPCPHAQVCCRPLAQ